MTEKLRKDFAFLFFFNTENQGNIWFLASAR